MNYENLIFIIILSWLNTFINVQLYKKSVSFFGLSRGVWASFRVSRLLPIIGLWLPLAKHYFNSRSLTLGAPSQSKVVPMTILYHWAKMLGYKKSVWNKEKTKKKTLKPLMIWRVNMSPPKQFYPTLNLMYYCPFSFYLKLARKSWVFNSCEIK